MRRWFVLLLLLLSNPAIADSFTITITTPSGACTSGCSKTYSDTGSQNPNTLLSKIIATYQQGCNTRLNGTCTSVQVVNFWADSLRDSTVGAVTSFDTTALQAGATAGYRPIAPQ